jgi:hypothetical protein
VGLLLVVIVTAASIQDRDGGRGILKLLRRALPGVRHIFADGGYQGRLVETATRLWGIVVEVVRKPVEQIGFAVLPRRWVVLLAVALAATRARLRAPARGARGIRQVGDGRAHAQPARTPTRPQALVNPEEA